MVGDPVPDPRRPAVTVLIPSLDGSRGGNVARLSAQVREALPDAEIDVVIGVRPNGRARNVGAARTRGRILICIDDDVSLGGPHVLPALIRTLEEHPEVGLCGPSQRIPPDSRWWQRIAARQIPRSQAPVVETLTDSDMVSHMCLALRRDVWDAVGGENGEIPRGTDPDLRARIRRAGLRVVIVPHTWAYHPMPPTLRGLLVGGFHKGVASARMHRWFPDLVYETPEHGAGGPTTAIGLPRRAVRSLGRFVRAAVTLQLLGVVYRALYILGYGLGYLGPLPPRPAPAVGRADAPGAAPQQR